MGEMERDIVTVKLTPKKEARLAMGMSSIIGTRSNQEDTIFGYVEGERAVAVVCDGMGGLSGGELASKAAAESLAGAWFLQKEIADIPAFLEAEAIKADEKVFLQEDASGKRLHAGTTIVAAIIRKNELYWMSVGDSKIYIVRGGEILSVCREHNYRLTLDARLRQGEMTPEEYAAEEYRAEALISYLGMGNVSLIDVNRKPFLLEDKDIVLLSSDGLYRSLSEEEILGILKACESDMETAAKALTAAALGEKTKGQDNTSVVILQYALTEAPVAFHSRKEGKEDELKTM